MSNSPRRDPIAERWAPVGEIFPVFVGLARASWREILLIWLIVTIGVLAAQALASLLPIPAAFLGLTPAIFPVAFGTAMAAHRLLWPTAPDIAECADVAMRAFPTILAVIAIRQVAISIGFTLLVLPGLAAAVFLLLAPVIVMAEGPGLRAAFERSFRLVVSIGWAVLALLLISALAGLILLVPIAILATPVAMFGEGMLQRVVEAGATAAFPLAFTVMGVAIYLHRATPGPAGR